MGSKGTMVVEWAEDERFVYVFGIFKSPLTTT